MVDSFCPRHTLRLLLFTSLYLCVITTCIGLDTGQLSLHVDSQGDGVAKNGNLGLRASLGKRPPKTNPVTPVSISGS